MEEKNITKSDEEKDLGITIGGKLKFQQHINVHFVDVVNYLIGFYQVRSHSSVLQ
jgi:hypothetical protein